MRVIILLCQEESHNPLQPQPHHNTDPPQTPEAQGSSPHLFAFKKEKIPGTPKVLLSEAAGPDALYEACPHTQMALAHPAPCQR